MPALDFNEYALSVELSKQRSKRLQRMVMKSAIDGDQNTVDLADINLIQEFE